MTTTYKKMLKQAINRVVNHLDIARDELSIEGQRVMPYPARIEEIAESIGRAYRETIQAANICRRINGKMERPE